MDAYGDPVEMSWPAWHWGSEAACLFLSSAVAVGCERLWRADRNHSRYPPASRSPSARNPGMVYVQGGTFPVPAGHREEEYRVMRSRT